MTLNIMESEKTVERKRGRAAKYKTEEEKLQARHDTAKTFFIIIIKIIYHFKKRYTMKRIKKY